MASFSHLTNEAKIIFDTLSDRAASIISPTIRLGVTGLSQAGKTVFITALVHALLGKNQLPLFKVSYEKRFLSVELNQQPDDHLARFEYEKHLDMITKDVLWPQSTRMLSELRIKINFKPRSSLMNYFNNNTLTIDLIDYPGEWLLDLPLLNKSYYEFSRDSLRQAQTFRHKKHAQDWLNLIHEIDINQKTNEEKTQLLSEAFTNYLKAAKLDPNAISMLPPGRFLMPGDYEGAPLLTFCPLPFQEETAIVENSLLSIMEKRYQAYKKHIIRPFFREHIARLDRQIILIDAMQAFNAGPKAIEELQQTLSEILSCFRPGKNSWLSHLFYHQIDRILVASTKADQLHHTNHERLQSLTNQLVNVAIEKAGLNGANIGSLAISSIRATHEATAKKQGEHLPLIVGTPMVGEKVHDTIFDGQTQTAIFPGDLPDKLNDIKHEGDLQFVRFRPPHLKNNEPFPHIRLDRALEFLIGDQFS